MRCKHQHTKPCHGSTAPWHEKKVDQKCHSEESGWKNNQFRQEAEMRAFWSLALGYVRSHTGATCNRIGQPG